MLRCFISYTQKDWSKYLPGLEFAHNNHVNDATKYSPFFLEYGQNPLSISDILHSDESSENKKTDKFIKNISEATKFAKLAIEQANLRNSDNLDNNKKQVEFEVGDKVMLSTRNLALKPGRIKKLSPKFIGPLTIVEKFADGRAYRLDLPRELRGLHHTFHISLLKKFEPDTFNRNAEKTEEATRRNFMSIEELLNPDS